MITFVVSGRPVPQPRPRAGKNDKTGKLMMYTPKSDAVHGYRQEVGWRCREAMPSGWDVGRPVRVIMEFVFPASGDEFVAREDVDNCAKSVLDGMKRVIYGDDRQVLSLTAFKRVTRVGESPCTRVTISQEEGDADGPATAAG